MKKSPRIKINKDKCKGCMLCVAVCPRALIVRSENLNKKGIYYIEVRDQKKCIGCGVCAIMCPDVCIEVYR